VHIYNVADVVDRDKRSVAEIIWSPDGLKAALLINRRPHAVIDFAARCSCCRAGFPPSSNEWRRGTWDDDLMTLFDAAL
jgi:hypothetical protein